jgi:hypothetical protein
MTMPKEIEDIIDEIKDPERDDEKYNHIEDKEKLKDKASK